MLVGLFITVACAIVALIALVFVLSVVSEKKATVGALMSSLVSLLVLAAASMGIYSGVHEVAKHGSATTTVQTVTVKSSHQVPHYERFEGVRAAWRTTEILAEEYPNVWISDTSNGTYTPGQKLQVKITRHKGEILSIELE